MQKNEEILGWKAHTNTWNLNSNVSKITDAFINQKRVILCERRGAEFTLFSHSLLIEKESVIFEIFQLNFVMFVFAFRLEISSFFSKRFLFLFLFFNIKVNCFLI